MKIENPSTISYAINGRVPLALINEAPAPKSSLDPAAELEHLTLAAKISGIDAEIVPPTNREVTAAGWPTLYHSRYRGCPVLPGFGRAG